MNLSSFASIGYLNLMPAIKLAPNYTEHIERSSLDVDASGCLSCPYSRDTKMCASCDRKKIKTVIETRYVNEKNRFGESRVLQKNALLLFLLLHFLSPDVSGLVSKVKRDEAAEILGCNEDTIDHSLALLAQRGYIDYSATDTGCYHLFITNFRRYFAPSNQGGRGFLRLSADTFKALCEMSGINAIRLALRSFIYNNDNENKGGVDYERSFKDIKRTLPVYVTKKNIREILSCNTFKKLFEVSVLKRSAVIVTKAIHNTSAHVNESKRICEQKVTAFVSSLSSEARKDKIHPLSFNNKELEDITNISIRYPVDFVLAGIRHFYDTYIKNGLPYDSAPSLIRTYASQMTYLDGLGMNVSNVF